MKLTTWIQSLKDAGKIPQDVKIKMVTKGTVHPSACLCSFRCSEGPETVCHCKCHGAYHTVTVRGSDFRAVIDIPRSIEIDVPIYIDSFAGKSMSLTR